MNTKRKPVDMKVVALIGLAAALLLCLVAAAYFVTPGVSLPQIGKGDVTFTLSNNGKVLITWPAAPGNALSRVTVRPEGDSNFKLLNEYPENAAVVDGDLLDKPFTLRIQSAVHGKNLLGMDRELLSLGSIEISVTPPYVMEPALSGEVVEPGKLRLDWDCDGTCELSRVDGQDYLPIQESGDGTMLLAFGDGGMELPSYDKPLHIAIRVVRRGNGYVIYGPYNSDFSVMREDLLGNELSLECQELDPRTYVLRWNEAKADYFEIQEWSENTKRWLTIATVQPSEPLRYETGTLRSGSDHKFRLVAVGGDQGTQNEPVEVSFRTGISSLYATIWPIVDLKFYEDVGMTKSLATIPAGTALCVLEEDGDLFQVRYKNQYGYVDNRFCMINLPEFVGDICAYSITNSYSSIFKVHDYPIEHVTGEVIQGFEGVNTAEDGYLVPYLFPSAKKLLTAAQAAEADRYRLRIYEAFRPNEATRYLYDTTLAQLDYPLPELDEQGNYIFYVPPEPDPETEEPTSEPAAEPAEEPAGTQEPAQTTEPAAEPEAQTTPEETLAVYESAADEPPVPELPPEYLEPDPMGGDSQPDPPADPEPPANPDPPASPEPEAPAGPSTPAAPSEPADTAPPESDETEGGLQEEPQPEPVEEPKGPTYRQIMTDGRFGINSFLAAAVSAHNRGIALDLTIEKLDGTPLQMQSNMHDLSWYSATSRNNDNAKLLEHYMTMAGVAMKGLTSEWWHFQDDETREKIELNSYLVKGITAEGWRYDGKGWRWRNADGSYARDTSVRSDGQRFTVDANGYVIE